MLMIKSLQMELLSFLTRYAVKLILERWRKHPKPSDRYVNCKKYSHNYLFYKVNLKRLNQPLQPVLELHHQLRRDQEYHLRRL
jgi:hypothetical protein